MPEVQQITLDGQLWVVDAGHKTWRTVVRDHCHVAVWPFGQSYQVKILVPYVHAQFEHPVAGKSVGIGLAMCSTREAAFRKGVAWATSYLVCAAPGPNTVIHELFGHWPMLYRTRADILNQLFMVLGGGYAWLDGAIVSKAPEDHLMDEDYLAGLDQPSLIPLGPILDDGAPRYFYPLSQRSNLQNVPDDVRSDWLQVAYEAAVMLRDRSKIEAAKNREIGAEVVRQLQDRFGDRVKTP